MLLDQLNIGGRLIIPLGPRDGAQMLTVVDKLKNGDVVLDPKLPVVYVPLTTIAEQINP